jgi:hypothetical protein
VLAEVEYSPDPHRIDHVQITLAIGHATELRAALNTISRRNRDAGFEPRIRVGVLRAIYEQLPEPGIYECDGFDYAEIESRENIFYEYREQREMESMLIEKAARAIMVEVWGDIYAHRHVGIHQIHSRRTSCAVAEDVMGRDGALNFYYAEENASELLLFKFCGQP